MKNHTLLVVGLAVAFGSSAGITSAHPGSGIVVDASGQVFFQDSAARTIWKIDARGKVTAHYDLPPAASRPPCSSPTEVPRSR